MNTIFTIHPSNLINTGPPKYRIAIRRQFDAPRPRSIFSIRRQKPLQNQFFKYYISLTHL